MIVFVSFIWCFTLKGKSYYNFLRKKTFCSICRLTYNGHMNEYFNFIAYLKVGDHYSSKVGTYVNKMARYHSCVTTPDNIYPTRRRHNSVIPRMKRSKSHSYWLYQGNDFLELASNNIVWSLDRKELQKCLKNFPWLIILELLMRLK